MNPCYRRESWNFKEPKEHGRTGWRSKNQGKQLIVSPMCPRLFTLGEHICTIPKVAFQMRIQNALRRVTEKITRRSQSYWALVTRPKAQGYNAELLRRYVILLLSRKKSTRPLTASYAAENTTFESGQRFEAVVTDSRYQ